MSLVFIPLGAADLDRFAAGEPYTGPAYATTPALFDALEYDASMAEDAEFAALTYASVAGLTHAPRRCVAVAEASYTVQDPSNDFGLVAVSAVPWSAVTSIFLGDDDGELLEKAAAPAIAGMSLADAWDCPEVEELLESSDLLWFGAEELDLIHSLLDRS